MTTPFAMSFMQFCNINVLGENIDTPVCYGVTILSQTICCDNLFNEKLLRSKPMVQYKRECVCMCVGKDQQQMNKFVCV